jgi:flagellar motor switch protein FliM
LTRKVLSQDEIDALFKKAQGTAASDSKAPARRASPFDIRRAGQLTVDQVRAVTNLHEAFARRLSSALGAYLRVGFDMDMVSVEQLTYAEFLFRLPDLTYLASLKVAPVDARAAIQMDLSLVYPIVDLVLGGAGSDEAALRDLTEIEEQILDTVIRQIARELQTTWQTVLEFEFALEQRQQRTQVQGLMLPTEKILSLSFEIRLPEAQGALNLALPAVVSNALLRKLSARWSGFERSASPDNRRRLRNHVLDCRYPVELALAPSHIPIRRLVDMQPGSVITLPQRVGEPIRLSVSGKPMFLADPVRCGAQRGARIRQRTSIAGKPGKDMK